MKWTIFGVWLGLILAGASTAAPWPALLSAGASESSARITGVAADGRGNVYAIGEFEGVLGTGSGIVSVGQQDVFVAKFDGGGQLVWLRGMGGSGRDRGHEIEVNGAGQIFISGTFDREVTIGSAELTASFLGAYVASIDPDGVWLWAEAKEHGNNLPSGHGVSASAGVYSANTPGSLTLTSNVLTKRRQDNGSESWALDLGAGFRVERVATGSDGRVFVELATTSVSAATVCGVPFSAGRRTLVLQVQDVLPESPSDPPSFGECIVSSIREVTGGILQGLAASGLESVYAGVEFGNNVLGPNLNVTKLSSTGTIAWTRAFFGDFIPDSPFEVGCCSESSVGVTMDALGDVYVSGVYHGRVLGETPTGNLFSLSDARPEPTLFVAKLSRADGEILWFNEIDPMGAATGDRLITTAITVDANGRLYVGGALDGIATFADSPTSEEDATLVSGRAGARDGAVQVFSGTLGLNASYDGTTTSQTTVEFSLAGGGNADIRFVDPVGGQSLLRIFAFRVDGTDSQAGFHIQANDRTGLQFERIFGYPHDKNDPTAHDYAVVVDPGGGEVRVYQDGELLDTSTGLDPSSVFVLGGLQASANPWPASTPGPVLADLRLYAGRARTQSEIEADLFTDSVDPTDLYVHYRFDEPSGTTLLDAGSSSARDATISGSPFNWGRTEVLRGPRSGFSDAYIARIDPVGGEWFESQIWTIGQRVPKPALAAGKPTIVVPGLDASEAEAFFFWNPVEAQLYAIAPVVATLLWPSDPDALSEAPSIERTGTSDFPAMPQLHVSGAPTKLSPTNGVRSLVGVAFPFDGAPLISTNADGEPTFSRTLQPGDNAFTVLHYVNGPQADPTAHPSEFQVVWTRSWDDAGFLEEASAGSCLIGSRLSDARHESATGANGWVVNARSHFDGVGVDAAYDRSAREGVIIPVNVDGEERDDDLAVAWYTTDALGVEWPDLPVRYDCRWPTPAEGLEEIVIASTIGTGPISADLFPNRRLYNQPDPALPGFNPNEEHARFLGSTAYALRSDLNEAIGASEPYALVKYQSPVDGDWAMRVFSVVASNATFPFGPRAAEPDPFELEVGLLVQAPSPLNQMPGCENETAVFPEPVAGVNTSAAWRSQADFLYARRATTSNSELSIRYAYPLDASFYYDLDGDGENDEPTGACLPWLSRLDGDLDTPVDVFYGFTWPAQAPLLSIGETLTVQKSGLPNIASQASVEVIYDEVAEADLADAPEVSAVRLYDPISERKVKLSSLPGALPTTTRAGRTRIDALPFVLRSRLSFDLNGKQLVFGGVLDTSRAGEPLLLPNVMTQRDLDDICAIVDCGAHADFADALERLRQRTRNPNCIDTDGDDLDGDGSPEPIGQGAPDDAYFVGFVDGNRSCDHVDFPGEIPVDFVPTADGVPDAEHFAGGPVALTAGAAADSGRVTLAFNDFEGGTVSLASIRVDCPVYRGEVIVLESDNLFEESLTLRHSGDFAGRADEIDFEWRFEEDTTGVPPTNDPDPAKASRFRDYETDFLAFPMTPASGAGAVDVTLKGPGVVALRDNWFVSHYRGPRRSDGTLVCEDPVRNDYSRWAGTPDGAFAQAQLAQGWIKRVVSRLNPFDARVRDFHSTPTNTIASMITQAGPRFEGPIALNPDPDNLNSVGLLEAYETLLRRGMDLSVNAGIRNGGANNQLLFAATRIADLYTLLANEAFSDASDPTIGIRTSGVFGSQASSLFAFQDQLATPLDEELVLLRGRDDRQSSVSTSPFYNRLIWNFTNGDGEVAYVSTYRMTDQNVDGVIDEGDGEIFHPQGHGDAWGHYLSSMTTRYRLLRHPDFDWLPRVESVLVAGTPIPVDFQDERKFARAAAAKARAGAEIVNLTYRKSYVEDPAGQWQGYKDTDPSGQRAWGLSGWARRAGQGAYFDWLLANSMLPDVDPNPAHTGIQKIDRTTVPELAEIASQYRAIETQMDQADRGLNPIGLAKGVVPFDIDPNFLEISSFNQGQTHFEQIASRAVDALQNAVTVFDFANQQSQALREVQDDVDALADLSVEQELDYKHRLIEIFGTPYSGDIGAGKTYPSGYTGPDVYRFQYVTTDLTRDIAIGDEVILGEFAPLEISESGVATCYFPSDLPASFAEGSCGDAGVDGLSVAYPLSTGADWSFIATPSMGARSAPGELQMAVSDLLQAQVALDQAELDHLDVIRQIEALADLVAARWGPGVRNGLTILNAQLGETQGLNAGIGVARGIAAGTRVASTAVRNTADVVQKSIPTEFTSNPGAYVAVAGISTTAEVAALVLDGVAEGAEFTAGSLELAKESVALQAAIDIESFGNTIEQQQARAELAQLVRDEALKRLTVAGQIEVVRQTSQRYSQLLAEGGRLLEERATFRNLSAASTQASRFRDMTFRIFRNDALQKFRAQRDLAARYVYLAASAYDYETNLLGGTTGSGRSILADVVRERSVGAMVNGVPSPGTPGLADILGRLLQNFAVLEGQLGFNNPQIETNRFSLRRELLRIRDGSDERWREALEGFRVDDLWQVPEFRRFARPFTVELLGPQPALVIPFSTTVNFGMNFFGQQLAGGDSAYDPTNFATKVRSAGIWFSEYDATGLSNTPRIYLIPVGADVMRAPTDFSLETREWRVVDQRIPEPFPVVATDLTDPDWIPRNDSLFGSFADIRRFSSFRAHHDAGSFSADEVVTDTRLIGRSVWNTRWLLIIPGGTLLFDPDEGLDTFINGPEIFPGAGIRTGEGIDDIKLFFETYGYSGG